MTGFFAAWAIFSFLIGIAILGERDRNYEVVVPLAIIIGGVLSAAVALSEF